MHLSLYFKSAAMQLRSNMQYKLSFTMQIVSMILMTGAEFVAVWFLLDRFGSIGQWNRNEIFFFFGLMQFSFAIVEFFCRGFTAFGTLIHTGSFDRVLLRPHSCFFSVLCSQFDPRRLGTMIVGFTCLALGSHYVGVIWTLDKVLCLLLSLIGGGCLFVGLFLIEATMTFWTVQSIEMANVLTYGGRTTCQYPLDIYPQRFQWLFLFVAPYGLTTHMPASYILGKQLFGLPPWTAFVTPLAGVVFLGIMCCVWYWGIRHYTSTGS